MEAYHALQEEAFNPNSWAAHAVDLLTSLVREFQNPDRQVLILPSETLFPLSWEASELKELYGLHDSVETPTSGSTDSRNFTNFLETFEMSEPTTWQKDWKLSYVLHGWNSGIEFNQLEGMFESFGGISLEYVLAKRSNFARAVYPAVRHALNEGYLDDKSLDSVERILP